MAFPTKKNATSGDAVGSTSRPFDMGRAAGRLFFTAGVVIFHNHLTPGPSPPPLAGLVAGVPQSTAEVVLFFPHVAYDTIGVFQ